jgi:adenine-specific DNA-methyltransferase
MRGFVPTPDLIVDLMVEKLFASKSPTTDEMLLDPGCGTGAFIDGLVRLTRKTGKRLPKIVGYESHPGRSAQAAKRFQDFPGIKIRSDDFLKVTDGPFDYVIGNPPYVPITEISDREKSKFRRRFASAEGRFDLYLLFFEQALRLLSLGGRLVFITPEKFLYVNTAKSFRRILSNYRVSEIELLDEDTFGDLVTYPTVTTIDSLPGNNAKTEIVLRDKSRRSFVFPQDGSSLQPLLHDALNTTETDVITLGDICVRISCGVATGSDSIFVRKNSELDSALEPFAFPTISGRDLSSERPKLDSNKSMLIPYDSGGRLLPLNRLGPFASYLNRADVKARLKERTCVARKPWHAFHDSVPLSDILKPKLICKDITPNPHFWIDRTGEIVPRHSVYYIVPLDLTKLETLCEFLNGPDASAWLRAHCQRASKGFLRLQTSVLKRLPIPRSFASNGGANVATKNGESRLMSAVEDEHALR